MSAIFGIYNFDDRPADKTNLVGMAESMAHRGPDATGFRDEGPVALGHCMLHTTPESLHELLPYIDNNTGLTITADARIDNRHELADKLHLSAQVKDGLPDSHLILAAYQKWGKECVQHLIGDFAFAIWDRREQHLFAARDHLGVKPFYYHRSNTFFVFSSEMRAILCEPRVPKTVNEPRIADFLVTELEGIDKTSTFYKNVFRLPPAHTITITAQQFSTCNYWNPDSEYELQLASDSEYIEKYQELLTESVRARLRCNSRPVSMLSGGIDSSSIVGIARKLTEQNNTRPFRVYSGISDKTEKCVESSFIQKVLALEGLESVSVRPADMENYHTRLLNILRKLDDPFDVGMTLIIVIYMMAQERKNSVMLDGVEGDMIHSLSPSYPSLLLRQGHACQAMNEMYGLWKNYYRKRIPLIKLVFQTSRAAFTPNTLRRLRRSLFSSNLFNTIKHDSVISRDFADRIDLAERLKKFHSHGCDGLCSSLRGLHVQSILHPYLSVGLERYDRIAALCSVEPRHPLLDKRLVEYCVSLPWNLKVRNGWSKYILRCSASETLPDEVCWRKGWEHVGWNFTSSLIKEAQNTIHHSIETSGHRLQLYIDKELLHNLKKKYNNVNNEDEGHLWTAFSLALWLEQND